MTKKDLVTSVSDVCEIAKKDAEEVIDATFEIITEAMQEGESVSIHGFGIFSTSERSARKGRNPSTGAEIDIPASIVPKFKASKTLKDALKE